MSPKKKKVVKEESPDFEIIEVTDDMIVPEEPEIKQMTRVEMLELRALHAEAKSVQLEVQLTMNLRDQLLKKIDPDGQLEKFMAVLRKAAQTGAQVSISQKDLKAQIEKRLGIKDLGQFAYDEETGTLRVPEQ